MASPVPFVESVEVVPSDESSDIARIAEIMRETLRIDFQQTGQARRDVHAKSNGCARGEFRVVSNLPTQLAQGLFAQAADYRAVVRFSNSAPWFQPDVVPDARGLAVQVEQITGENLTPSGTTQDFVMVNHPCFVVKNVKEFLRVEEARLEAGERPLMLAASLAAGKRNPLHWPWRSLAAFAGIAAQPVSNPASYTYFSMVPFRYGDFVAKYRVRPSSELSDSILSTATRAVSERDAMRHLLEESLAMRDVSFDFQVQLRTSEASMPIEDASVVWSEDESPFQTVAQLFLPRQDIKEPTDTASCEHRRFSVWNSLPTHRPLGGLNRCRRVAYPVSSDFRMTSGRFNSHAVNPDAG